MLRKVAVIFAVWTTLSLADCLDLVAEVIGNPLPQDGIYFRAVPEKYAADIVDGVLPLSRAPFAFIGAAEDLPREISSADLAKPLALFSDHEGLIPQDTSDYVIIKFRFRCDLPSLVTPIDPEEKRGYGFKEGGRTRGGIREWIIRSDLNLEDEIEFLEND